MADYPSGAFVTEHGVKNVALEFNTCIYKAMEVPVKADRNNVNFAKPLACFKWQNVYVYDFQKAEFKSDWVDVPILDQPPVRVHHYPAVIFITVFLLAVLILLLRRSYLQKVHRR
jgi:hypothetical protein